MVWSRKIVANVIGLMPAVGFMHYTSLANLEADS